MDNRPRGRHEGVGRVIVGNTPVWGRPTFFPEFPAPETVPNATCGSHLS